MMFKLEYADLFENQPDMKLFWWMAQKAFSKKSYFGPIFITVKMVSSKKFGEYFNLVPLWLVNAESVGT